MSPNCACGARRRLWALLAVIVVPVPAPPTTEVVLAHYNEDVSWIGEYKEKFPEVGFTVYTKSGNASALPAGAISLANVGRESQTYVHHIVLRYATLAEWTVFSHAEAPTHGYQGHRKGGGHMTGRWTFADYLTKVGESLFVFSDAIEIPSLMHVSRADYILSSLDPDPKAPWVGNVEGSRKVCPHWKAWSKWWRADWLKEHLEKMRSQQQGLSALEFYFDAVAGVPFVNRSVVLAFAQGARFSLSREQIWKRPLSYYKYLLFLLTHHRDPLASFYLEWMWYDVFHPDSMQHFVGPRCNIPARPAAEDIVEYEEMRTDVMMRFGPALNDEFIQYHKDSQLDAAHDQPLPVVTASVDRAIVLACAECFVADPLGECAIRASMCIGRCWTDGQAIGYTFDCGEGENADIQQPEGIELLLR